MKYGLLRKLLTLSVTISLLFSTPTDVIAGSLDNDSCKKDINSFIEEDFGETFDIIISNLEAYGMQDYIDADFTVDDLSILEPVDFIEKNDLSHASASDGIYHFPVMIKGRVVLIYDVIETDSGYTSTLGADFSPLLDSVICNEEKYADFYQDDYSLYALTSNYVYTQKGNAVFVDTLEDSSLPIVSGRQDSSGDCYNFECNIEYTEAAKNSVQNHTERLVAYSTAVTGTENLSGYPIVHQRIGETQHGMCWAATVASMVRFEKPTLYPSLSAENVCDYMGIGYDDGGTNDEAKTALNHYLGNPYSPSITSVLSTNDIYVIINNVDPAYMQCRRKVGFLTYNYHAVALTGYSFTSSKTTIRIMDPAYECFKTCTYADGDWTFDFGDYKYKWYKTIRLMYTN